jgi:hypothetical protein
MRMHSLMIASALAIGLAIPATAQQSMHRYASFFKYSDVTRQSHASAVVHVDGQVPGLKHAQLC